MPNQALNSISLTAIRSACACLPLVDQGYWLSLGVNLAMYAALCTAWTLFSGPTHYVSLATAAFFGLGTYAVDAGIEVDAAGEILNRLVVLGPFRSYGSDRAGRRLARVPQRHTSPSRDRAWPAAQRAPTRDVLSIVPRREGAKA